MNILPEMCLRTKKFLLNYGSHLDFWSRLGRGLHIPSAVTNIPITFLQVQFNWDTVLYNWVVNSEAWIITRNFCVHNYDTNLGCLQMDFHCILYSIFHSPTQTCRSDVRFLKLA